MTGKIVNAVMHRHEDNGQPSEYTAIQVATIVSFVAGICQVNIVLISQRF